MIYKEIKSELKKERNIIHMTKKELSLILEAIESNNWDKVKETKLYTKYSGEYCEILAIINNKKGE